MNGLYDFLNNSVTKFPDKPAIISTDGSGNYATTTYSELVEKVDRYAAYCQKNMNEGELVPVLMRRGVEMVAAVLGVMVAGRCVAPLNNKLKLPQVMQVINRDVVCDVLIDSAGVLTLRNARELSNKHFSCALHWIDSSKAEPIHNSVSNTLASFMRIIRDKDLFRDKSFRRTISVGEKNPGACLFTSGSTGVPKGVLISQNDLMARAETEVEWYELTSEDALLNILPFSFDVGFNQLLSTVISGATLVISDSWLATDIVNLAAEHKVTGVSGVPAIWRNLIQTNTKFKHPQIRFITVSGGDLPGSQLRKLPALANKLKIFKTYGQTEAFRITSLKPEEFFNKMGSVGRAFGKGRFLVLREDGALAEANETGEVVHMGLGTMLGYIGELECQDKLRKNLLPEFSESYPHILFTGDIGYIDEDGFLFLKGRKDSMLKVQGNRIYPSEVVAQIMNVEFIQQAEVVGIKDKNGETVLVAFVRADTNMLNERQLRVRLGEKLPSYMVPKFIKFCQYFPSTKTGKADLYQLKIDAKELAQAT